MPTDKRHPRFLGLALTSGPQRLQQGAQVAVDRGLASGKADFFDVSDLELLQFIEGASTYLRQKAEHALKNEGKAGKRNV